MPLNRRLALLDWAQRSNAYILEDDYDGELRYSSHPIAALQGLDKEGRVIYLGTFSKVLFPALRLGYLVLPAPILPIFLKAKELVDRGAPTLTQAAVADTHPMANLPMMSVLTIYLQAPQLCFPVSVERWPILRCHRSRCTVADRIEIPLYTLRVRKGIRAVQATYETSIFHCAALAAP